MVVAGSQGMNAASSRSHSVFSIKLARRGASASASNANAAAGPVLKATIAGDESVVATMNIVDLAGVEVTHSCCRFPHNFSTTIIPQPNCIPQF